MTVDFRTYRRSRQSRAGLGTAGLAVAVLLAFTLAIVVGSTWVPPLEVATSVLHLAPDASTDFIVQELRLPRASASLLVGMALGVSGTVFQRLLGNPLASPDFLGVSSGAGTAAVAGLVLWQLSGLALSLAALVGAMVTSVAVYVLSWRGGLTGYRFILVGVGVASFTASVTGYLLLKAEVADARAATMWLIGSSGLAGEAQVRALGLTLLVAVPAAMLLGRRLLVLELGDDTAHGLGVAVERERRALLAIAVVLVALATAAAGLIAFVALIAGPVAARLLRSAGTGILGAGCVGALLMLGADLVGQHLLPTPLATGVVTGLVGAPYLGWLLITTNRGGAGG